MLCTNYPGAKTKNNYDFIHRLMSVTLNKWYCELVWLQRLVIIVVILWLVNLILLSAGAGLLHVV